MAGPAAEIAPDVHEPVFGNERLRLLEGQLAPGATSALHGHANYLAYALADATVRLGDAPGEGREVEIHHGDTTWREAGEHSAANVGSAEMRSFIELT